MLRETRPKAARSIDVPKALRGPRLVKAAPARGGALSCIPGAKTATAMKKNPAEAGEIAWDREVLLVAAAVVVAASDQQHFIQQAGTFPHALFDGGGNLRVVLEELA